MLRVAIVGCGKIADAHAAQIQHIPGCQLVAACDHEELMARQFCERFAVKAQFNDVREMLARSTPDVVHITTPPQSHFSLGKACLSSGCHVFIEKPFTVCAWEADELIALAQWNGLKLTVGHDAQFSHAARRLRQLAGSGYLGGPAVHMESSYCYDLTDPAYARAFLSDRRHWVRALPGKLLQNIVSHGLARIAEFLPDDAPEVLAVAFASARLAASGDDGLLDELRVIVRASSGSTAYFTFSSQMRPLLHEFRVYGPRNGAILDEDHQTVIRCRGKNYKSYADKFIPPVDAAWQNLRNLGFNARRFMASDFHMKGGLKHLIECFYRSIDHDEPPPIPYREIMLTSRLMDGIFAQVYRGEPPRAGAPGQESPAAAQCVPSP
jgi:predicted dehydrogenase